MSEGASKQSNGLGTAALALGIIGLILAFIPFVNFATGIIPLIGLILGLVGLGKLPKGRAIAGVITSGVALVMTIIMITVYMGIFFVAVGSAVEEQNTPVSVEYSVTGAATDATVTYSTYTNSQSGTEQATGQTLPFSKTVTGTKGWSSYSLTATNGADDKSDISCKITVDGEVVAEQTSTGSFATVNCTAN